jgi:hypothetical protein
MQQPLAILMQNTMNVVFIKQPMAAKPGTVFYTPMIPAAVQI